jgi:hypothetical protein
VGKIRTASILLTLALGAPALALAQQPAANVSFFITSAGAGQGGNLGGLEGADRHCQALAQSVGAGTKTWHAYLSTQAREGQPAVEARSRIGTGPWYNVRGVMIAENVDELHLNNMIRKNTGLNEKGEQVAGRGDQPRNRHDILTGSQPDGTAYAPAEDKTCNNWTSGAEGSAQVGHHDRQGGGFTSWNSAHGSRGCTQENLISTGGDGLLYCFAIN